MFQGKGLALLLLSKDRGRLADEFPELPGKIIAVPEPEPAGFKQCYKPQALIA